MYTGNMIHNERSPLTTSTPTTPIFRCWSCETLPPDFPRRPCSLRSLYCHCRRRPPLLSYVTWAASFTWREHLSAPFCSSDPNMKLSAPCTTPFYHIHYLFVPVSRRTVSTPRVDRESSVEGVGGLERLELAQQALQPFLL